MARGVTMASSRGPAHRRRSSKEIQRELRELGSRAPSLSDADLRDLARERARHVLTRAVVTVVVTLVVSLAALQWLRPVPAPRFVASTPSSVRLPGTAPRLDWPSAGAATLSVEGVSSLGSVGPTSPMLVGGLAQVMTAYVVLQDHPLSAGAAGPAIPVTPSVLAFYRSVENSQPVLPLTAGESLTELQALQGILVASGSDVATLLADWDSGSVPQFVAKMNAVGRRIGLQSTTFDDPSGFLLGTESTPSDMVRLGEAAMALPAFRAIVSMPQAVLPVAGLVYNLDTDVGSDGFVGIKTGSDTDSGGCFLFDAQQVVDGTTVSVVGAVLGQFSATPTTTALVEADRLVRGVFAVVRRFPVVTRGAPMGRVVTSWGASAPVQASTDGNVVGTAGTVVPLHTTPRGLSPTVPAGAAVGVLHGTLGAAQLRVVLRTTRALPGPSVIWRLTRL